jgi:hypothetical protein
MKLQFEQNISQWHPAGLPNERMSEHISIIKHKVALLQKMMLCQSAFSDVLNSGYRNLKVQPFYSPRNNGHGYRQVPQILLRGVWLRKIGFEIDDYARIITFPKLIIITSSCLEFRPFIEGPQTRVFMVGKYW